MSESTVLVVLVVALALQSAWSVWLCMRGMRVSAPWPRAIIAMLAAFMLLATVTMLVWLACDHDKVVWTAACVVGFTTQFYITVGFVRLSRPDNKACRKPWSRYAVRLMVAPMVIIVVVLLLSFV